MQFYKLIIFDNIDSRKPCWSWWDQHLRCQRNIRCSVTSATSPTDGRRKRWTRSIRACWSTTRISLRSRETWVASPRNNACNSIICGRGSARTNTVDFVFATVNQRLRQRARIARIPGSFATPLRRSRRWTSAKTNLFFIALWWVRSMISLPYFDLTSVFTFGCICKNNCKWIARYVIFLWY